MILPFKSLQCSHKQVSDTRCLALYDCEFVCEHLRGSGAAAPKGTKSCRTQGDFGSSVRPSVHPSVYPSIHPSVRPSVRPSVISVSTRSTYCSLEHWFIQRYLIIISISEYGLRPPGCDKWFALVAVHHARNINNINHNQTRISTMTTFISRCVASL